MAEWKETEGPALGRSTLQHYSHAFRYVLPTFGDMDIQSINRKSIQAFLSKQAKRYSKSALKSMRLVMCMVLKWAERNGELTQPNGWLEGIRLPRVVGKKVIRTELKPQQTLAFVERMKEPYSTLVLLLASTGLRGEEAVGFKPPDLDSNNVLHLRRVFYHGQVDELETERLLSLDAVLHAELIARMRFLGEGREWIFQSRAGTPVNMGNARSRYLQPTAAAIGVKIGGWHDFRHTLVRSLRRAGVNPVVISGIVGHKKVEMAAEVYDKASAADMRQALGMGNQLLPELLPPGTVQ